MGRQLRLNLEKPVVYGRDRFVASPANEAALEALDAFPEPDGGVLALVGPLGAGKTHLASDWAEGKGAVYFGDVAVAVADLASLEGRPVVVDDADKVDDETLFHLINLAQTRGGGLLLTSQARPAAWRCALPDLRSRLNAIRVVEIGAPDDVVMWALLERFFEQAGIKPSQELLEYLVRRIERSAVAAREIVARLDEAAGPEHRPVTRALAREILETEIDSGDLLD